MIDIDPPRVTWHATYMNSISFGIENGDIGDASGIRPPTAGATSRWWRHFTSAAAGADDLAGLALHAVVHPAVGDGDGPNVSPIWLPTTRYAGPGDTAHASDFRTLALLSRYLAEHLGVPRNFTLLPYESRAANATSVDVLRRMVLADERGDMLLRMYGRTRAEFESNAATLQPWYAGCRVVGRPTQLNSGSTVNVNSAWTNFFADFPTTTESAKRCFRGFLSHAMPGSINHLHDHNCPGPYFDWHRFAREVWDWWWYPLDFVVNPTVGLAPATAIRPYRQARRDTPLTD